MPAGIVTALAAEARLLTSGPVKAGSAALLQGGARLFLCGMGAERARAAARRLLEEGATGLVSWGFAGGLLPLTPAGALLLPEKVIAGDGSEYTAHPPWRERLMEELKDSRPHGGALAQSTAVQASGKEKEAFRRRTGAVAVDLESASIALAAREAGIPFIALRVVSDPAEMSIPPWLVKVVDEFGRIRLFRFLRALSGHPGDLPGLIRLGRNVGAAREALATAARRAESLFSGPETC